MDHNLISNAHGLRVKMNPYGQSRSAILCRIMNEVQEMAELKDTDSIYWCRRDVDLEKVKDWVSTRVLLEQLSNPEQTEGA
jgi:hypothetical protein